MPSRRLVLMTLVVSLSGTACGDGNGSSDAGNLQAFCDQAAALDGLDRHPNDEELDRLIELAPDEVRDESLILVDSAREFRDGNDNAADSPTVQEAGDRFDQYVEANCEG